MTSCLISEPTETLIVYRRMLVLCRSREAGKVATHPEASVILRGGGLEHLVVAYAARVLALEFDPRSASRSLVLPSLLEVDQIGPSDFLANSHEDLRPGLSYRARGARLGLRF